VTTLRRQAITLADLPRKDEELVVVEIVDHLADTSVVHLPVYPRRFKAFDFPPSTWVSKCGVHGSVYAHAGEFTDAPVCLECLAL